MNKIKFEVEIDATNGQHLLAVTNFLQAIGNTAETATPAPKQETPKETAKETAKETTKETAKETAKETTKETAKTEETPKEETKKAKAPKIEKTTSDIDIVKVRALLATKVSDHRTEIKNELTKLGASSVSTLDAKHYQTFVDFLNSL